MKKIAFIGFGILGNQILNYLEEEGEKVEYVIYDDILASKNIPEVKPFYGFKNNLVESYEYCICLGYKHLNLKNEIITFLENKRINIFNYIHKTSYIHKSVNLGKGIIIFPGCIIEQNVSLGSGSILHNNVVISHNSRIDRCVYLSPSVTLSGFVKIGCCSFLGTGTLVSNYITIGSNTIIGIGSVVTKDISDNVSAIGNPIKILSKKLNIK